MKNERLCFYDGINLSIDDPKCTKYLLDNYHRYNFEETSIQGEIITYKGKFNGFTVIIENERYPYIKLRGSFHKYYFQGLCIS